MCYALLSTDYKVGKWDLLISLLTGLALKVHRKIIRTLHDAHRHDTQLIKAMKANKNQRNINYFYILNTA